MGPLESDMEDDVAEVSEAVAEDPGNRDKAAAKRPRRHAGSQDPSRCAISYMLLLHIIL